MYGQTIKDIFIKAAIDEISSVIFYLDISNRLSGKNSSEFRQIMAEHADEEMTHFKLIMEKAANLGITIPVCNYNIPFIDNIDTMISKVQQLEEDARNLYNFATNLARDEADFELEEFFSDLLEDETTHFDDVAKITGQTRTLFNTDCVSSPESKPAPVTLNPVELPDITTYIKSL